MALLVDAAGHDSDFAFTGGDDTRAVGADEARLVEVDGGGGANHIDHRDAFRDADDERDFRVGGFENGVGRIRRRNENYGGVGAGGFHCFLNSVEYGAFEMFCASLTRRYATDDVCAVFNHLLRVEGAFATGEALDDQASFFVHQDTHRAPPASCTTFCA